MPYTLWSRDRLLGESELDYAQVLENVRTGDFIATEMGEKLMPILTGVRSTLLEMVRTENRGTAEADVGAAQTHFESLELQLRASDGSVVPTEWIDVRDTESIMNAADDDLSEIDFSLGDDPFSEVLDEIEQDAALMEEEFAELQRDLSYEGDDDARPFPRYQIQVELHHKQSIA